MGSILGIWLVGFGLLAAPCEEPKLQRFDFHEIHMGVSFDISLYARNEVSANQAARAAYNRVRVLNRIMSDYDAESELMRLCRSSRPGKPVKVSPELLHVLSRAETLSQRTNGAFDVSVGPTVRLWRRARRRKELPNPELLNKAQSVVGFRSIRIEKCAGTIELLKAGMRLDLGGIAKGYAGDEALAVLKQKGICRAMIDASGDIVVSDPPPGKEGWKIGIAPLEKPDGTPSRFLLLKNQAVATSGDAFQFVEIGGKRYSHIVNPQTGLGLTTRSSVTVIAENGIAADSLASAVSVLGPKQGLRLIETTPGSAALVLQRNAGKPMVFTSKRLKDYVSRMEE